MAVWWTLALAIPAVAYGQGGFAPQGNEYPVAGALTGDQVYPHVAISTTGGYVVWQDNITDGAGLGISARRLDSSLSGVLSTFRVNQQAADDQERAQVTLLKNGGAAFAWQGGRQGFQNIYARFMGADGTFAGGDIMVNSSTNNSKLSPAITTLTNGEVVVVWASWNQHSATSMQDVYAQRFTAAGQKLGGEFLINQNYTAYNQRTPALAPLSDGRFVVVWISEHNRFENSVDVYARLYTSAGAPAGNAFLVNTTTNICANPSVAASSDGGFLVGWMQKDLAMQDNSWDIFVRPFSSAGLGGTTRRVNTYVYGDQYLVKLSALGTDYLAIWTSMGQDGSREGIYGRFLANDGSSSGDEFRVNSTTVSQQMHPAVASDRVSRFLVTWTSFVGGANSFDLYAQRYASTAQPLLPPERPFVSVLSSNSLSVTWAELAGFDVAHYEIYVNGSATPTVAVTNNWHTLTGLTPSTTYTVRLAYVLVDGRRSPLSAQASGTTYGTWTWGGIPYEWMIANFGSDLFAWPSPHTDSDGDGVSNLNEFLSGTDPNDPNSVLRTRLQQTPQGLFLVWNTQPGLIYQVQTSVNLQGWVDLGGPRFAAGSTDSMYVGGGSAGSYYRVVRVR
jgi:hypothetical protein